MDLNQHYAMLLGLGESWPTIMPMFENMPRDSVLSAF